MAHKVVDPYADGKYENPDGSPIDITSKLTKGLIGGGSKKYAENYDRIFGKEDDKKKQENDARAPNK